MKFKSVHLFALIFPFIIVSCKEYDANGNLIKSYEQLDKASWMLGEWEKKDSLGILTENWKPLDDSTYVGTSYFVINKKDTVHSEQIELMEQEEHLIYRATVKGENNNMPIPFQLTSDKDSLLVFENPKHDFPQKIQYKLQKNGTVVATVSGTQNGKSSSESYPMNKVK